MSLPDLLTDIGAVYRLTRLVQRDTLPPVEKTREWVRANGPDWAVELIVCPWCASMWVGGAVAVLRRGSPRLWGPAATALTASAVTGLVMTQLDRPD